MPGAHDGPGGRDDRPAVPVCGPGDLAVTVHWQREGNGLHGQVVAENIGGRRCRLPGKPTVAPLGQDGDPLPAGTTVTLEMMQPGYVVLSPGDRAAARVSWPNWCGRQAPRSPAASQAGQAT
jgi:hypothetical protein